MPATLVGALADRLSEVTGFSTDAVRPAAIERFLERRWRSDPRLKDADLVWPASDELVRALVPEVVVTETYFFRQPDQWVQLSREVLPDLLRTGRTHLRALIAGCATGEEAYTAAAVLEAAVGPSGTFDVLGLDLLERNVERARAGRYDVRSLRDAGPELFPLFVSARDPERVIRPALKERCRFAVHNLLEPLVADEPPFDLILCRNVLAYLRADRAERALRNLLARLAPGGVIAFGPMDWVSSPPGLVALGPAQLQLFQSGEDGSRSETRSRPALPPARPPLPAAVPDAARVDPERLHMAALALGDGGDEGGALAQLRALVTRHPSYVPGLVDLAVALRRSGDPASAAVLMRRALEQLRGRADDEVLSAPEPLHVSFYRASAQALLHSAEGAP